MRVLLVSKPVAPPFHDGTKCLVRDLALALRAAEPTVLTTRGAPSLGGRVRSEAIYPAAGTFAPALVDNARVLGRLLLGDRHDLWHFVFAPNPRSSYVSNLARRVRRAPTVQTVASAPLSYDRVERLLFGDRVVCLSRHTRDALVRAGARPSRLEVIAPPLPPLSPVTAEMQRRARALAGVPAEGPMVLYPGDLETSSGARLVAEATPAILAGAPGAAVVFACRAKTARAAGAAQRLGAQLAPFGGRVVFAGEVADLPALAASAALVVFPVDNLYGKVDLPIAVLEAMSLAVPVVTLAQGPLAELEGVLSLQDGARLAPACLELLGDAGARRQLGEAGRAYTLERHAPSRVAEAYEAIYRTLAGP